MLPDWEWQVLSLPPRYFSWRIRGNPLYWSLAEREVLERHYDLLVATSMVDLATLRGLVPALAAIPTALYFHENQFEYPQGRQQHGLLEAQMVSLYSALAADRLLFNSQYNLDSFIAGCTRLLGKMPDHVPGGIEKMLCERATVLPVPLTQEGVVQAGWPGVQGNYPQRPLRLLWSARFEHDKGGQLLLQILQQLETCELEYELALTGQQFRNSPAVFNEIEQNFAHRLVQFGYVTSAEEYAQLQHGADLVISTAEHEFQGLAVLQAVRAGCLPVVPGRLAYPENYGQDFCYLSVPGDLEAEAHGAVELILSLCASVARGELAPDVSHFSTANLAGHYRKKLESLAAHVG